MRHPTEMRAHRLSRKKPPAPMANAAPTVRPMPVERSKASKCRKDEKTTHRPTAAQRQARARRQMLRNWLGSLRIPGALNGQHERPEPAATGVRNSWRSERLAPVRSMLVRLVASHFVLLPSSLTDCATSSAAGWSSTAARRRSFRGYRSGESSAVRSASGSPKRMNQGSPCFGRQGRLGIRGIQARKMLTASETAMNEYHRSHKPVTLQPSLMASGSLVERPWTAAPPGYFFNAPKTCWSVAVVRATGFCRICRSSSATILNSPSMPLLVT
jgi:hypothetical protein